MKIKETIMSWWRRLPRSVEQETEDKIDDAKQVLNMKLKHNERQKDVLVERAKRTVEIGRALDVAIEAIAILNRQRGRGNVEKSK